MAPLRDYIPSPGMFRDDGTIFLIFLRGSTRSPLIGNRCAFNLPPTHRGSDSYIGLPRVFSDIFAVYFTFHGKLTRTRRGGFVHVTSKELWRIIGNEEWGSNPSSYLWNRLELAWFNFAFELRDLFAPFWVLKHLDRIQALRPEEKKRNKYSFRDDDE